MDVKSDYPTRKVMDYLFVFDTVKPYSVTVDCETEWVNEHEDRFEFISQSGERGTFYKSKMSMFTVREREEVVYPKGESPAEKEIARIAAQNESRQPDMRPAARLRGIARNRVKEHSNE